MISKEKASDNDKVFTSVGNAWILCRSKTYRGRVYYFNTLTGKTAWNLSDAEMERAQRRAKEHTNREGSIENCPEPTEPPDENFETNALNVNHKNLPSKVYNKQIINNQFSKGPLGTYITSQCSKCSNSSSFNPNIWTFPQTQPILLAPANATMLYQQQPTYNIPNLLDQNTTASQLNDNASWENETPGSLKHPKNYNKKRWSNSRIPQQRQNNTRKFEYINKSQDLRQVLADKRKKKHFKSSCETEPSAENLQDTDCMKQNSTQTEDCVSSSQDTLKDELYPSDIDEEWLEENTYYKGAKPLINITPLTSLRSTSARSDCWYIVVDTTVLINNLDFLNVLVNSDDNCLLMTPQSIIEELKITKETGSAQEKKRSRRAMVFLSQQINSGNAFIGEDEYHNTELGNHEALICCLSLTQDNNFAVMLSNNPEVTQYDVRVPFPMFTVPYLKEFLTTRKTEKELLSPEEDTDRPLTVTINNDFENISVDEPDNSSQRTKVSIAVQTDIDDVNLSLLNTKWFSPSTQNLSMRNETSNDKPVAVDKPLHSNSFVSVTRLNNFENTNSNNSVITNKKREIRLKRFVSIPGKNTEANTETKEKKQFKWHRRRNKSCSETVTKTNSSEDAVNKQDKQVNTEEHIHREVSNLDQQTANKSNSSESPMKQNGNISYGSDAVNSESSFSFVPRRNSDKRVTIEETSASGCMSNSASIVDSENMTDILKPTSILCNNDILKPNNANSTPINTTVGITSLFMEDNLKRKCDEWVSRYTQIMEDVLTEVLQQDPSFRQMLPPWTMHEAVECVKRKFFTHLDVVDACSKLSDILSKVSNSKGVTNRNMSPINFMEMYSYGVDLINTLLNINDSEDLLMAAESLSKLKSDIQDPVMDTLQNESFTDNLNDLTLNEVANSSSPMKASERNLSISSPKQIRSEQVSVDSPRSSSSKYNLRSNRMEKQQEKEILQKEVQFVRKVDKEYTFFDSLSLAKKHHNTENGMDKSVDNVKGALDNNNTAEEEICDNFNQNDTTASSEPKIIRNFTQCLEFEQKLKSKQKETIDYDQLDYNEINEEEDYACNNDNYDNNYYEDDKNESSHDAYQNEDSYFSDFCNTASFKVFIGQLWCEIKDIFSTVHIFCVDTIEDLQGSSQLTHSKILQIKYQAEEAQVHINNLCEALLNIKLEDVQSEEYSVQDVLRRAGIEINCDVTMNEEQFDKFRDIVAKCMDQAHILLESISVIYKAIPT